MSERMSLDRETPVPVYIGLGANLDDPRQQVERALSELQALPQSRLAAISRRYRTAPVGPKDQPDFVNAVARVDTLLDPMTLLALLQRIERRHGRIRNGRRWGPRTLDLDVLLFGDQVLDEPRLCIPHPQMHSRAFVLVPLADIASAELMVPGRGRLGDLLDQVAEAARTMLPLQVAAEDEPAAAEPDAAEPDAPLKRASLP